MELAAAAARARTAAHAKENVDLAARMAAQIEHMELAAAALAAAKAKADAAAARAIAARTAAREAAARRQVSMDDLLRWAASAPTAAPAVRGGGAETRAATVLQARARGAVARTAARRVREAGGARAGTGVELRPGHEWIF